ncbi:MAG TPA: rhomboid family intramembrane serine protease [Polyangiaceae bacterium]|jgi:membrane associated rhomboid family serine protease
MIPIGDANPTRSFPFVNYALLAVNVLAWFWQLGLMQQGAAWVVPGYGMVPSRLTLDPLGEAFTVLSSMFMHGGWAHVGGNMLFLYVFGDNVEDALGHLRYAVFYLIGGVAAAMAQLGTDPGSTIPMVGASGAIAAVLGAYLVLYPRAPVTVLFGFFFLVFPAWLVVGEWFLWQLIMGVGSLGAEGGGVAFFAHIGGFIAGLLGVRPFMAGRHKAEADQWHGWRPPPRRIATSPWRSSRPRPGRWDPWN